MEGDVDESSVPIIYNLIFNIPYTCIPHVWNGNVSYRLVMSAIVRMRAWHAHATYPAPENFSINAEFSRKHGKAERSHVSTRKQPLLRGRGRLMLEMSARRQWPRPTAPAFHRNALHRSFVLVRREMR